MKKRVIAFLLCTVLLLTGCSSKNSNTVGGMSGETVTSEKNSSKSKNNAEVYADAESTTNIKMGINENGAPKELFSVEIPTNYYITCNYMDGEGETYPMIDEAYGSQVSYVIEEEKFDYTDKIPLEAFLHGPEESYSLLIRNKEDYKKDAEIDKNDPSRIDIGNDDNHKAYICKSADDSSYVVVHFVYEINDNWLLILTGSGDRLKNEMSLEDIGNSLYDLITPL